jgi:hypothetical protein
MLIDHSETFGMHLARNENFFERIDVKRLEASEGN